MWSSGLYTVYKYVSVFDKYPHLSDANASALNPHSAAFQLTTQWTWKHFTSYKVVYKL